MTIDKRDLFSKGLDYKNAEFDGTDLMKVGETAAGFLPGVGQVVSPIIAAPRAAMEGSRDLEWIQENFSVQSFEQQAAVDPLFKKELEAVNDRIIHAVATSAAGAVGGAAGGWAGAELGAMAGAWGGPIGIAIGGGAGFIAGAALGSTATSYPVDYILSSPRTDAFAVIGGIQEDIKAGAGIDHRKVFVSLAASLPDFALPKDPDSGMNYIEKKLSKLSDGKIKSLQEALEKQPEIIDALMADRNIDSKIKEYNNMVVVPDINDKSGQYTARTATELFSEQLEAGVDPRILVLRQKRMQLVDKINLDVLQESVGTPAMADDTIAHDATPRDTEGRAAGHRKKGKSSPVVG